MMNDPQKIEQEKSVLRWGGLAGMLGGIFFILTMVVLGVVGLVAAALQMVDLASVIGVGSYFAMGWKVYSLSKAL